MLMYLKSLRKNIRDLHITKKRAFLWFLFLFVRYTVIYLGAWQLDILCANLVYPVKDSLFYFWFFAMTKWDAYALFFWTFALGSFLPEIAFVVKKLSKWRFVLVG